MSNVTPSDGSVKISGDNGYPVLIRTDGSQNSQLFMFSTREQACAALNNAAKSGGYFNALPLFDVNKA